MAMFPGDPMRKTILAVAALTIGCNSAQPDQQPSQADVCANASIDDGSACTIDACDRATGAVTHTLVPAAILSGTPAGLLYTEPIAPTTSNGFSVCPNGANPGATPPTCIAETDLASAVLTLDQVTGTSFRLGGTVPVRLQNAPVEYRTFLGATLTGSLTVTGNAACPGTNQTFLGVPLTITFDTGAAPGNALSLDIVIDQTTIQNGLSVCGTALAGIAGLLKQAAAAQIAQSAQASVTSLVEAQLCLAGPSCPAGATPDQNGLCRYSSGLCVARGVDTSGTLLTACLPHPGGI